MPTTLKYAIAYPAGTVAPNVPAVMQTQAQSVEAALKTIDAPPVAYSFVDSQPNYDFQGTCTVTTFPDGRKRVDVDLTMVRQNATNSVTTTRQDMGVVLPAAAIGAGNTKVLACPFSIGTNIIYVAIRPSTGVLTFWSQTTLTWAIGDYVSLNFSYWIPAP